MIVFHYGTMGAGKSKQCIEMANRLMSSNLPCMVFAADGLNVDSRNGKSIKAKETADVDFAKLQCPSGCIILIDEAQFLPESQIHDLFKRHDWEIHLFGLRTSMDGFAYPASALIMSCCDRIEYIPHKCESLGCENEAQFNLLLDDDHNAISEYQHHDDTDNTTWVSVCPVCFDKIMSGKE